MSRFADKKIWDKKIPENLLAAYLLAPLRFLVLRMESWQSSAYNPPRLISQFAELDIGATNNPIKENFMPISASLLPELDHEMAGTRKTLERIPADKLDFRPHPKSFTMISLATHIAHMVGWGSITINENSFDIAPPGAGEYREEPAASVAELLEKFDKNLAEFRAALASASDEHLRADWSLLMGGNTLFTKPRVAVVRGDILNHLVHHRAQLTVYLRMNDVPVPALYGPSADET